MIQSLSKFVTDCMTVAYSINHPSGQEDYHLRYRYIRLSDNRGRFFQVLSPPPLIVADVRLQPSFTKGPPWSTPSAPPLRRSVPPGHQSPACCAAGLGPLTGCTSPARTAPPHPRRAKAGSSCTASANAAIATGILCWRLSRTASKATSAPAARSDLLTLNPTFVRARLAGRRGRALPTWPAEDSSQ